MAYSGSCLLSKKLNFSLSRGHVLNWPTRKFIKKYLGGHPDPAKRCGFGIRNNGKKVTYLVISVAEAGGNILRAAELLQQVELEGSVHPLVVDVGDCTQ